MAGILITPERLSNAPPVVRDWLENEMARHAKEIPSPSAIPPHLAALDLPNAQALLSRVAGNLPVANLLFELARAGAPARPGGIDVAPVAELVLHARFDSAARVFKAIDVLNKVVQDVLGDPSAMICAIDPRGAYFIASETRKTLALLWQALVTSFHDLQAAPEKSTPAGVPQELSEHGAISGALRPGAFAWSVPTQSDQT